MIPFAILSCQIEQKGYKNQEVRILDLSEEGFTFRLAQDLAWKNAVSLVLHFFRFQESRYRKVVLSDVHPEIAERQEFYTLYRVTTANAEYHQCAKNLMKEYMNYISLRLNEEDAELSKALVGYPAELEEQYASDFVEQRNRWNQEKQWASAVAGEYELALSLDHPLKWETYLKIPMEQFAGNYWKQNGLSHHPLAQRKITHLYIGNQFCHLLFPEENVLFSLLEKAEQEHVEPVFVFTYMQESRIGETEHLLSLLGKWCKNRQKQLELLVNDWGMMSLIREKGYDCFILTLGVLLQKRRKDARMKYKQGFWQYKELIGEGAVQADFYREYLWEHFQIERISYEACGYPVKTAPGKASLHLPFYQMNTSQHCTLYAGCHNGDRGRQSSVTACPGYCRDQVFLYPEMLHMVGRYNSLFGYDETVLKDETILKSYLEQGVDRIVMELL